MAQEPTLESLLAPAVEALKSIQQSLATLADVQVAAEFEPDHEKRLDIYKRMDKAAFDDAQVCGQIEALHSRRKELEGSGDAEGANAALASDYRQTLDARQQTLAAMDDLKKMFPAMSRLHSTIRRV